MRDRILGRLAALLLGLACTHPLQAYKNQKYAFGYTHSLAIVDGIGLYGTGRNTSYQLGLGNTTNQTQFTLIAGGNWRHVTAGNNYVLALKSDSTLWGWGTDSYTGFWAGSAGSKTTPYQMGTDRWITVQTSHLTQSSLGIKSDSSLWAWGQNSSGQLGDSTQSSKTTPVQIGSAKWLDVSVGGRHSLGIQADGSLWAWGNNSNRQLGDSTSTASLKPKLISDSDWIMVATSYSTSYAIRSDSTLWAWGNNTAGGTGLGLTTGFTMRPTQVGSSKWIRISASSESSLDYYGVVVALRADSTLFTWGYGAYRHLGNGGSSNVSTPGQISSQKWVDVAMGGMGAGGKKASGETWGWGYNINSAIGDGTSTIRSTPVAALFPKANQTLGFPSLAAKAYGDADFDPGASASSGLTVGYTSSDTTVATIVSGQVHIVGVGTTTITASQAGNTYYNAAADSAQTLTVGKGSQTITFNALADKTLGDADFSLGATASSGLAVTYASSDTAVATVSGSTVTLVGAGTATITASQAGNGNYNAATAATQTLTVNKASQTITFAALPSSKTILDADFDPGATASSGLAVSYASSDTTVATIVSGQIHLVGAGTATITASQAGNGSYNAATNVTRTLTVGSPSHPHKDRKISGAGGGAIVIREGIGLYGTGSNSGYRLGLGDQTDRNRFHLISLGNWRHVDGGEAYVLALQEDSTLWGWGNQPYGFGDGATQRTTPTQIGTDRWITVSAGLYVYANFGIRADSTLWAWGSNGNSIHGDGTSTSKSTPTQIGSAKWLEVSHASNHVLALKSDHTLWSWGLASFGKLGNGATSGTVSTPAQIGSARWRMVAAGNTTSFAIKSDSTLWAWGSNSSGGTGLGSTSGNTTVPTQVGSHKWIWVDAGSGTAVALRADSTFWSWGINSQGLVAQGSSSSVTTPTQVGSGKWRQVGISTSNGMGQRDSGDYYGWGANASGAVGDSSNTDRTTPALAKFNRTQTLTFPAFSAKAYGDADFAPGATSSAGLALSYASSNTAVATLVAGQIHIVGAGTTTLTASQAGNAAYDAAESTQSLTVSKADQTLAFAAPATKIVGDADFAPGATASSGLAVSYASSDTTVATIVSGQIHIVGAGTTTITASQAGNGNYNAAPDSSHTLTVNKVAQAITFTSLASKTFGDSAFVLGATAGSGLAVTYTSSNTAVATVSGSTVTIVGAGSTDITASQAGSATYAAATPVARTLTVGKASQSLTFAPLSDKTYGDADFAPGGTASSGLTVSYASSDTTVAKIVGGQIRIVGPGTATLTAYQAGNDNYQAASDVARSLTVSKASQTITFGTLTAKTFGDSAFSLGATASSGLPVSYASSNTAVATVSGSMVTLVGAGTATITATQSGNADYQAASDVARSLTVGNASQTITFAALSDKTYGDADFAPGATASSGLAVSYASSDTTVATIVSGQVHIVGAGTTTLTAAQAGNGNYNTATNATQTLMVNKAAQAITFPTLSDKTYGDADYAPGATASSGLTVSFTSSDTAVAKIVSGQIRIVGPGTATITASQSGNGNYNGAADVARSLTVGKASQTITFGSLAAKTFGDSAFALGAMASSGLPVTYASSNTAVATVSGSTVTLVGAGTATLTASQAGNANYLAAADVTRSLTVGNASQTLTFSSLSDKTYGDADFSPGATASSGLAVSYASSDTTVATITSGQIRILGAGTTQITASQAGNGDYQAATSVARSLTVHKASQAITFSSLASRTFGDSSFTLGATASSGLPISYTSSNPSVATVSGSTVTLVGAGTATLSASQAGNGNYNAATIVTQTLTVNKADQAIAFAALSGKTYGDADYAPGATASSGLAVSYASSDTAVATIVSGRIHIVGPGTTTVTASQAGNADYLAATDVARSLTVGNASQTIAFATLSDKTYGDADFSPGATASSSLPVSYASSDTTVATIVSGQVHIVGAGITTLTAIQPGNGNYSAATAVTRTLTVHKAAQAITFAALAAKTFGDSAFALGATTSSGLPTTYTSSNTAVATISGSTVTVVGAGTATITTSQAGNGNYIAATNVTQTLTVNKAAQAITFATLSDKTYGDTDFSPGASASSGLGLTYASSDTAVAKIVSGQIRIVGPGTATITASQAGNANYLAAADVTRSLTVGNASQTITFATLSDKTYGDADFSPGATASSGLAVSYASSDTTVATITSGQIRILGAGTTQITASQAGNGNYNGAADVARSLTVGKASQTIIFESLAAKTFGDSAFTLGATASSGLPVTYFSSNPSVATVSGSTVTLVGAGTATLTASQAGNGNYQAASSVTQTLTVAKASQAITFATLPAKTFGDADFPPGATTNSGLPVSYASSNPAVATVVSGQIHIVGAGITDITSSLDGSGDYEAGVSITRTLTVAKAPQSLTFATLVPKTFGDADFALVATSSSGLPVTFTSSDTTVATLVSGQIHIVGAGTATLTASQGGNGNYLPAADAGQSFTVHKASQTLTFAALPNKTFGEAEFAPGATASSGLPVTYASSDSTVARMVDGKIRLMGSGTVHITASQGGSSNYLAAVPVTQTFSVEKAGHTVTFLLGADSLKTEGDPAFRLHATSNVGLPVLFTSSDTAVAQVFGDSVRVGREGFAELVARQDGNGQYAAAPPVTRSLRVRIAVPTALAVEDLVPRAAEALDTNVRLAWPRKAKAQGYRLQATLDTAGIALFDSNMEDTTRILGSLPFGAKVYWRVAPFNTTGQAAYSAYAAFQVRPAPPKPIDLARIPIPPSEGTATTVELTWPSMGYTTGYRFQLSLDSTQAPHLDTVLAQPILTLADLAPGSTQRWRVAPMNGVSEAPFTPWLTFKVRDKEEAGVSRGVVVDSVKPVQMTEVVAVVPKDSSLAGITVSITEEKQAPANLPEGFLPLTGNINLEASLGTTHVTDSQITITLTPPDTALNGTRIDKALEPLVYTVDSATGRLEVVYDLPRDTAGNIVLPLSKGRRFLLAVDTVPPVVKDSTPSVAQQAGSAPVITGVVEDNIRNCRTVLHFRKGGSETFDSIPVTIDATGRFELPLSLQLDSTGFEYHLKATDGRNVQATPAKDVPVEVRALKASDSLPSMQWRLFALPTLPKGVHWQDRVADLGVYGRDWKLFTRTPGGLRELGTDPAQAEAGVAYWFKSRRGFLPSLSDGVAAPVSKPFGITLPPRSWISFGNPFMFPVAWQSVVDSTRPSPGSLFGPYTYRDTAWVAPVELPALLPWEGYYAYNASDDTLRLRIPALKAKSQQPPLARAAFNLEWQVRGEDGKDAGNFFGGLPTGTASGNPLAKAASGKAGDAVWQTPKPEAPDAELRAGFLPQGEAAGLLQTDFRALPPQGGLTWTARLSGLRAGKRYTNRFEGYAALPKGMVMAVADPATGNFVTWSDAQSYVVEAQAGETTRELQLYAGTPEYVKARGVDFAIAHPFTAELKNFPNPVRAFTVVNFAVPASAQGRLPVRLTVRDMQGRLVKVLASGPMSTGRYSVRWEVRDGRGREIAGGVYQLSLEVGRKRLIRSLQILK